MSDDNYGNTWAKETAEDGAFVRHQTSFRSMCSAEAGAEFPAESGRYHLYVSYACPWAHRTLIVRKLKGLEDAISFDVVNPILPRGGWSFGTDVAGATGDRINAFKDPRDAYFASNPSYEGAITVPVFWDKVGNRIVNNESSEIIRFLNTEFQAFANEPELDLYPTALQGQIDERMDLSINQQWRLPLWLRQEPECLQQSLPRAIQPMDRVEGILSKQRFLTGDGITEADVRLFTTLVRFDAVYLTHFKTNLRRLTEYPAM
jgi:putative glutathione S-transferase